MKGDMISRSALEKTLVKHYGEDDRSYDAATALTAVQLAPAVDAVPVVHGRWVHTHKHNSWFTECYECSACGFEDADGFGGNYCPNCGAKMDGSEGE